MKRLLDSWATSLLEHPDPPSWDGPPSDGWGWAETEGPQKGEKGGCAMVPLTLIRALWRGRARTPL